MHPTPLWMDNKLCDRDRSIMHVPDEIRPLILDTFLYHAAYGQFATVNQSSIPSVRTVHFHFIPDRDQLVVSTNLKSEKCTHIQHNPFVSGCYWYQQKGVQIRFQATASIISENDVVKDPLLETMWNKMRT